MSGICSDRLPMPTMVRSHSVPIAFSHRSFGTVRWFSARAASAVRFFSCKSPSVSGARNASSGLVRIVRLILPVGPFNIHQNVLYYFGLAKSDLMYVDGNQNWIRKFSLVVVECNDSASHRHHDPVNFTIVVCVIESSGSAHDVDNIFVPAQ